MKKKKKKKKKQEKKRVQEYEKMRMREKRADTEWAKLALKFYIVYFDQYKIFINGS